jgi:glutamyl-tRNA(Gln) amidotransferase subunit D
MSYATGDRVKVITEEEEVEGILMPRPGLLDESAVIIKLDNGYNIGIDKKKIKQILLAEKYAPAEQKPAKLKHNPNLPNISVLSLGGTISSKIDYRTGGVHADYTAEDFVQMLPGLQDIANIKARKVMSTMSEDLASDDWKIIASSIAEELNSGADGVVVTQGTDTFHFSTAITSFMLRNLAKPVVFTASQRSIDRGSSDAFMNLKCAIIAAAKSDLAEVVSCMHGTSSDDYCLLIRGTKVRKMHTSRRDAFRPINELPLAKVFEDGKIEYLNEQFRKASDASDAKPEGSKFSVDDKFEEKTAMILAYPGMDPGIIDYYIDKGYKGIVIAATALGHVPLVNQKHSLLPGLQRAAEKNIPVVIATQTIYGRVHPNVYTALRRLSVELKCIFAEDMLPEVAYVKLGWVLGHTTVLDEVRNMMLTNFAGEMTERTDAESYLY